MMNMCGDNRFEVIARAKEHLLDATNIETSEEEMAVLDNFLFRCWQMGWLNKYDESADAVSQSEQYKKGFEDAKRAFELEFAREAESIQKQNAQLEVMLNIQKALLAERNWIPCSERLPSVYGEYLATVDGETIEVSYVPETKGLVKGWSTCDAYGYKGLSDDDVIAWRPKPAPYKESEVEE